MAPRDVPAGKNFAESIIKAIDTCKVFVLIWSASTNTSEHILNEINRAFDKGITIIPFRIQDVQPTDAMSYYFGRTHWLDALTPPLEKHIAILAATILANLGRSPEVKMEPEQVKEEPEQVKEEPARMEPKAEEVKPQAIPTTKKEPLRQVKKQEKATAVRAKAAAPKKGVNTLPIAAGAVAVVILIVLSLSGVFKGSAPEGNAQATQSQTTITSPPPTQKAATATPESPPWVNEFAEPILAAIKDREPDFQDDFSIDQPAWTFDIFIHPGFDCASSSMKISNGRMQMKIDPGCQVNAHLKNLLLNNYVVQVDTYYHQLDGSYEVSTQINGYEPDNCVHQRYFDLRVRGKWGLHVCNFQEQGYISFDPAEPVTITMISNGTENAIYVNTIPVVFFNDNEKPLKNNYMTLLSGNLGEGVISNGMVEFDNLKVWDLDKIENVDW